MIKTEKIDKNTKEIINLVDKYIIDEKRKIDFQTFFDKYGDRYFTCPGSSRLSHHEAFTGGLAQHSLNVVLLLFKFVKILLPANKYSKETLITVSLMHDVGKIGDSKNDYYIPEESEWHRNNLGRMYTINEKFMGGHHSRNSLFILQDCGFILTEDEFQAILYHDGQSLDINKDINLRERDLGLLLYYSDRFSIQYKVNK